MNFVPLLSVMNYCRATFEIMTRIRQMAPLLYIINFSKLRFRAKDERTLISAKNCVDMSSISEVRSYITEWPRFFGPPCIYRLLYCGPIYYIMSTLPLRFKSVKNNYTLRNLINSSVHTFSVKLFNSTVQNFITT